MTSPNPIPCAESRKELPTPPCVDARRLLELKGLPVEALPGVGRVGVCCTELVFRADVVDLVCCCGGGRGGAVCCPPLVKVLVLPPPLTLPTLPLDPAAFGMGCNGRVLSLYPELIDVRTFELLFDDGGCCLLGGGGDRLILLLLLPYGFETDEVKIACSAGEVRDDLDARALFC